MPAAANSVAKKKPWVTANQVTLARLALLPIGSILLYQGKRGAVAALISMTVVGCTDFVDGWLARRQGPTVLGGLMDPVADKVFIAMTMLPELDLGWLPVAIVAAIFLREFVVTAARTMYSRRDVSLKTTYLAKVKTWYQMIAGGYIFLLAISPTGFRLVTLSLVVGALVGGVIYFVLKRKIWRGAVAMFFSFGLWLALTPWDNERLIARTPMLALGLGLLAVVATWVSGGAYLFGLKQLVGKKRLDRHDAVRFFGALTMPIFASLLMSLHALPSPCQFACFKQGGHGWTGPSWLVFSTVALEFSIGGLDNLLAHQKDIGGAAPWAARVILQTLLLGGALYVALIGGDDLLINALNAAAFAVTLVAAVISFTVHRGAYLADQQTVAVAEADLI